jgi:hypothetical protein
MRIHMLPCENVTVGRKQLMTRSFTWGDQFLRRAKTSRMVPCEDVLVGPKEVTTRCFTWSWLVPWVGQDKPYVAIWKCLGWPKGSDNAILHMRCYESSRHAKMTRLARKNSLGGPRRRWNVDERTKALSWVNSLFPWSSGLNEFLGKTPLVLR